LNNKKTKNTVEVSDNEVKFVQIPKWLMKETTPQEYLIYSAMMAYSGNKGQKNHLLCFASQEVLAKDTNLSVSTVKRHIKTLQEKGIINITQDKAQNGKWLHNKYTLCWDWFEYFCKNINKPEFIDNVSELAPGLNEVISNLTDRSSSMVHGEDVTVAHLEQNRSSSVTKRETTGDLLTIPILTIPNITRPILENLKNFQQLTTVEDCRELDNALKESNWFEKTENNTVAKEKLTLYKNALASIFYDDIDDVNTNEWNKMAKAGKLLFESKVSPLSIKVLAQNIAKTWGEGAVTVTSLPEHTDLRYEARDKGKEAYNTNQVDPAIEAKHAAIREKAYIQAELAPRKKAYNDKRIINNEQPVHLDNITEEMLKEAGL
jgi:predicted transcriptional regulator|tara:strand:- start:44 stop:1171 length:1128 start_codon:yes stop_codon:yes gene_type:complete